MSANKVTYVPFSSESFDVVMENMRKNDFVVQLKLRQDKYSNFIIMMNTFVDKVSGCMPARSYAFYLEYNYHQRKRVLDFLDHHGEEIMVEQGVIVPIIPEVEELPVFDLPMDENQFLSVTSYINNVWFKNKLRELNVKYLDFLMVLNQYMKRVQCQRGTAMYFGQWLDMSRKWRNECISWVESRCELERGIEQSGFFEEKAFEEEIVELENFPVFDWEDEEIIEDLTEEELEENRRMEVIAQVDDVMSEWCQDQRRRFCRYFVRKCMRIAGLQYHGMRIYYEAAFPEFVENFPDFALDRVYAWDARIARIPLGVVEPGTNENLPEPEEMMIEQGDSGQNTTNLESVENVSSSANLTLVDERPIDTATLHTKGDISGGDASVAISENSWFMRDVLTREYPLESFEWKVSMVEGQSILYRGVPKLIFNDPFCLIRQQLRFFAFMRAGVRIRVQLNGTKFHLGRLIGFFRPLGWFGDDKLNCAALTCWPHFFIDAAVSNSGEITIPYTHLMSYFSQAKGTCYDDQINSLGTFILQVYNPLQASENSPQSLFGQLYVSLIDPQVHLPTKDITDFSYGLGLMNDTYGVEQGMMEGALKREAGGVVTKGISTGLVWLLDKMTGGLVTGVGDGICNLLGICDKPTDPLGPIPVINRTLDAPCHGTGLDHSTRLGLTQIAQTDTTPAILGAVDSDFNILTLCKMPCLMEKIEIKGSDLPGSLMYEQLVTPTYISYSQYQKDDEAKLANYQPSMLAYVSRAFCYYRGGFKLKLQFIQTQFHTLRIAVVHDPHGCSNLNLEDYLNNRSHNVVIADVVEKHEFVIDIPYFSVKPWTRCDRFRSIANLKDQSTIINPSYLDCDVNGVIRIYILNSLVHPDNVPDKISMNVFFYAADDFELAVPNTLAPLSVRVGPKTSKRSNTPRYPWCSRSVLKTCNITDEILALHAAGQALVTRLHLLRGPSWTQPVIRVYSTEAVTFRNRMDKVSVYAENQPDDSNCLQLINSLPNYIQPTIPLAPQMVEQGVETYTTTRRKEGDEVVITKGKNEASVAPLTVSENAMNLQTVLRRYYPLWISPDLDHSVDFTVITLPVSPSFVPDSQENSLYSSINRRYEVNTLAWFSTLFTYNRGGLRYMVVLNVDDADVYVWHNPTDAKDFSVVSGVDHHHLTQQMCFATELAVSRVQQGVQVEVPFFSAFNQLCHSHSRHIRDLRAQNGTLYIAVRNRQKVFNVSIFISTADDFFFNVLRAPPIIHEPFAYAYTDDGAGPEVHYPEFQVSMTHTSNTFQVPYAPSFDRFKGAFSNCPIPEAADVMEEQMFSGVIGTDKIVDSIQESLQPVNKAVKEVSDNVNQFVNEVRDDVLPAVLGHAKVFHQDVVKTQEMFADLAPKIKEAAEYMNAFNIQAKQAADATYQSAQAAEVMFQGVGGIVQMLHIASIYMNLVLFVKTRKFEHLFNILINAGFLFRVEVNKFAEWIIQQVKDSWSKVPNRAGATAYAKQKAGEMRDRVFGREQADDDSVMDSIVGALAALATVIYCAIFGSLPSWATVKAGVRKIIEGEEEEKKTTGVEQGGMADFLRSMHFSNMGMKAINSAFEFFQGWVRKIIDYFLGNDAPHVILEREFNERADEIETWMEKVEKMEDEDLLLLALTDSEIHNTFYMLADQGAEFTRWTLRDRVPRNVSTLIRDTNKRIHDLVLKLRTIQPGHGFRYAPFTVMLNGPSGIAKSSMMHKFTTVIAEQLGLPKFNRVCAVPRSDKYLDGYFGQPILEWDDMFQCPDQDTMAADFINWRSNADCIVNKAKAEEKGMHFTSKAIIMSSNVDNIRINAIRDQNAFRNRINCRFSCKLAPGFTAARLKTMPRDESFSFVLLDLYYPDADGKKYELAQADMTLADALERVRIDLARWDKKQKEAIGEYMTRTGSQRMPRGVFEAPPYGVTISAEGSLDADEEEDETDFSDESESEVEEQSGVSTVENGAIPKRIYRVSVEKGIPLTEEERIEAELFFLRFKKLTREEKEAFLTQRAKRVNTDERWWTLMKRKFSAIKNSICSAARKFYDEHPNLVLITSLLASIVPIGFALKTLWSMFSTGEEETTYSGNIDKAPVKNIILAEETVKREEVAKKEETSYAGGEKTPVKVVISPEGKEEGTCDEHGVRLAHNKIFPRVNVIGWHDAPIKAMMNGLMIGGKLLLCPHHFFRRAKKGEFFFISQGGTKVLIEFDPAQMCRIKEKDACIYYLGPRANSSRNLVDCFIKEKDLSRLGKFTQSLLIGKTLDGVMMEKNGPAERDVEMQYQGTDVGAPIYKQHGWKYLFNTLAGECGSPLILLSTALPAPARVAGIHTAGYANTTGGFSVLLTREHLEEAIQTLIAKFGQQVYAAPLPPQVDISEQAFIDKVKLKPEGYFSYMGVMDAGFCPSQPQKTCFRRTPWQGQLYEVETAPALLHPTPDGRRPLQNALNKYGHETRGFSRDLIKAVGRDMLNELAMFESDLDARPTDLETAVFGIPGVAYCDPMNMKSSPGWPYQCLNKNQYGKGYLFDLENRKVTDEKLLEALERRENLAMKGERVPSIWRDCMKDELRPLAKVKAGKTRLFNIAPVDFTILTRKYFLAFEQMFYKHHSQFFSAVGINPESYEWTQAYQRLRSYGEMCVAGDFGTYDGTLMAEVMAEIGEVIDAWYKLKGETDPYATIVRRVLFDEMIHTIQLVQNCVYKTHQGNPSGNPVTVIINTMANAFYMRCSYLELARKHEPQVATLEDYHRNVVEEMYGDDNRLVIRQAIIQWFNQLTITECLAEHGIEYTDETKQIGTTPWRPLLTTGFLKRTYRVDEEIGKDVVLPQMSVTTIKSLTNWYRDGLDTAEQLRMNHEAALDFAFFHGRQFYEEFNDKLSGAMRSHKIKPVSKTYDEQLDRFLLMMHGDGNGDYQNFCNLGF